METSRAIVKIGDSSPLRAELKTRIKMYENDWTDLLKSELGVQFVKETYELIKLMPDTGLNIFRRIIREICTVYKKPAERGLESGESKRWEELKKIMKINTVMAEAHRLSKAGTASFIMVRAIPDTDKIRLSLLTPDQVHVEEDKEDCTEMKSISYFVEGKDIEGKKVRFWVYYSPDNRYYLRDDGKPFENHPLTHETYEIENKYGIIPIVPFHAVYPVRAFWRENWNRDAYDANMIIGVLNTYLNYLVKTQSFKQIVLVGAEISNSLKNGILDPSFPIPLPEGGSANTLDLQTNLEAIEKVIRGKVSAIANNYGISNENFTLSGQIASGYSLKIANRALEEIREADIPLCTDVEKNLFNVIRAVNNVEFPKNQIPGSAELSFNPGEITFPMEWVEEQSRWEFEFEHGISNSVDYLLKQDPDLEREDAIKRLQKIKEENKEIKPQKSLLDIVTNQDRTTRPASLIPRQENK